MKITVERFNEYVRQYVKGVLLPNAKSSITKFKIGFVLGTDVLAMNSQMLESMKTLGVADDSGIEMDRLKKAVYSGLDASGEIAVPQLGIHLDRPDVDRFFALVETGAIG